MSTVSSVATSKVNSVVRRSSATSSKASNASSMVSRSSVSTCLTAVLEEKLCVDEYGYTKMTCKRCSSQLSIEEVMALVVPLNEDFTAKKEVENIDFDSIDYLCLNCYADTIRLRGAMRA